MKLILTYIRKHIGLFCTGRAFSAVIQTVDGGAVHNDPPCTSQFKRACVYIIYNYFFACVLEPSKLFSAPHFMIS